jgi:hypothetical protein
MLRVWPGERLWLEVIYERRLWHPNLAAKVLQQVRMLLILMVESPDSQLCSLISALQAIENKDKDQLTKRRQELIGNKLKGLKAGNVRM